MTVRAIQALTPNLFRVVTEHIALSGATPEASLANLLGSISFPTAANYRISGHNGKPMSLGLHIRFDGAPMSGKTEAGRFLVPIKEAMSDWKKPWLFANVNVPTIQRRIREGAVFSLLAMAEGKGFLKSQFSHAFDVLNELYDGQVMPFARSDDDDDIALDAYVSTVFCVCSNVHPADNRAWLERHKGHDYGAGYLYRLLMLTTDQQAVEGAGGTQPEVALLEFDHRVIQLISSGIGRLSTMSPDQLPVIEVSSEANLLLRQGKQHFQGMAGFALPPNEANVFAVRLAANARRIAGCMHVYEDYEGAVSVETMGRALTIAECFGDAWLRIVCPPPKPAPIQQELIDADCVWGHLYEHRRRSGQSCWTRRWLMAQMANLGFTSARAKKALVALCGSRRAQWLAEQPIIEGRRQDVLVLTDMPFALPANQPKRLTSVQEGLPVVSAKYLCD